MSYYFRPSYPVEELEEETVPEDDAELTLNKVDEEFVVCVLLNFFFIFTFEFLSFLLIPLFSGMYLFSLFLEKKSF